MNCPNCQADNAETAKFCSNCGYGLTQVCPNCSTKNALDANFCINCGEQLNSAAAAPQDKLLQYIPKELLDKLESARAGHTMAGERRVVTILFCDVKGSTAAAEQMDPEDWAEIMNGAFEHLIAPVYRYEGTLARLMGDAVLAFFGAPIAHEDDPERAVMAGLEIVEGIEPYREEVRETWNVEFNVRVGINTGLVVVGEVGSDLRMEYTAMGDAVNLAARMEQTAQPGTVQIAEETHKRVAPLFKLENLGNVEVKGKSAPVAAYRPLRRKSSPGRLRGIRGLQSPLIGRASEMEVLQNAIDDLRQGHGGVVCLVAEAGLGKSRLIDELRASLEGEQHYWAQSYGISYETDRPYGQFQQQFRHLWNTTGSGIDRAQLTTALNELPPTEQEDAFQALETILMSDSQPNGDALEGEDLKRALFAANLGVWRKQMENAPTVLVFDDLHWADSASTELLTHLLQLTDSGPILLLCAFRPDRSAPSWKVKQAAETDFPHRYKEIALQPLTESGSRELVDQLLAISELPPKLHKLIRDRAEGNPFFVEEVIRSLIDSGAIIRDEEGARWTEYVEVGDLIIPDNLQSLLISRIDRLEGEAKHTLQLASVIGRSFYFRVLQSISEAVDMLDGHLRVLQRVELILESGRDPELEYAFRHALTQEAAYRSILRKERRAYHLQVGKALEELFPGRETEFAPLLAHHFLEAGDSRGPHYAISAGDEALRLYALEDAIRHYRRALDAGEVESLSHIYTQLGRSYELLDHYEDALGIYDEMQSAAQSRANGEMELVALTESAKIYSIPSPHYSLDRARQLSDEALDVARRLENHEAEARILWNRSNSEKFAGEPELAVEYGDQSLALAERYDLQEQLAFTLNDIAGSLMMLGELDRSREALMRSHQMWLEAGDKPMLADNLQTQAALSYWEGSYEQAIAFAQEGSEITKAIDNNWGHATCLMRIGIVSAELGHLDRGVEAHEECLRLAEMIGLRLPILVVGSALALTYRTLGAMEQAWNTMELAQSVDHDEFRSIWPMVWASTAKLHLWTGDLAAAREALDKSYEDFNPMGILSFADSVFIADAEVSLAEGRPEHALERLDELLELASRTGLRPPVPEALMFKALSLRAQGASQDANELLRRAQQEAEEMDSGRLLWRILLERSRLEAEMGNEAEATRLRSEAGARASELLDRITTPELHQSFKALSDVQEALAA